MFKNIDEVKKFIEKENIVNVDIRSIAKNQVNCVTFSTDFVIKNSDYFFIKGHRSKNIVFGGIDFNSSFEEVFLTHKTLVFFAEDMYSAPEDSKVYAREIKYSFAISDNKVDFLASPERDNYRDFLGEIVSSLNDIDEKFAYFYCDKDNLYSIVLQNSSKYSQEKVKYAILMVAKAYNVSIDESKGIFKKA